MSQQLVSLTRDLLFKYEKLYLTKSPITLECTRQAFNRLNEHVCRHRVNINLNWIYANILAYYALVYFSKGQCAMAISIVEHIVFIRLMKCNHVANWPLQLERDFYSLFLLRLFTYNNRIGNTIKELK